MLPHQNVNSFGVKTTAETGQCLVQNESFLETSNFKKKVSGLHEFADKRDKRKKMTLTMGMENLKKEKWGVLLQSLSLRLLGILRCLFWEHSEPCPASDPSMPLKTAGASFLL